MKFPSSTLACFVSAIVTLPLLTQAALSNCTDYASVAAGSLCLDRPSDCTKTEMVQAGDTCGSIVARVGNITTSMLWYLNPDISTSCLLLRAYTPVCVAVPWYTYTTPPPTPRGTVVSTVGRGPTALPIPIAWGTNSTCNRYELAGWPVYASDMIAANNITADQFVQWNPDSKPGPFGGEPIVSAEYWYGVDC